MGAESLSLVALAMLGREHGGAGWYYRAGEVVRRMAEETSQPFGRACDVTALLSPRVRVAQNLAYARAYLSGEPLRGVLPSVRTALERYAATGEIRGPKVAAFARALRGDHSVVVVDTWILKALGIDRLRSRADYQRAAARVVSLSYRLRRVSTDPWPHATTQACLWVGFQVARGRTPGDFGGDS